MQRPFSALVTASLALLAFSIALLPAGCSDDTGGDPDGSVLDGATTDAADDAGLQLATWSDRSPAGTEGIDFPHSRQRHAMAHDSNRGVTVLFGGRDSNTIIRADTWEWNGTTWTDVSPTPAASPPVRRAHAMAFDSTRNVVVLFGGEDDDYFADTWEWNGTTWTDVSPAGTAGVDFPSARGDHAMAFDAARGVTVLFGGDTAAGSSSETWEWNGTAWSNRSPAGTPGADFPTARHNHAIAYDSMRERVTLFGGHTGAAAADTWEWNGATWTDVTPSGTAGTDFPAGRRRHIAVYDAARGRLVVFGGDDGAMRFADTWEWTGSAWNRVQTAATPTARGFHAAAYDAGRDKIVLFGGYPGGSSYSDETWEYP